MSDAFFDMQDLFAAAMVSDEGVIGPCIGVDTTIDLTTDLEAGLAPAFDADAWAI